jgi:hypothetical protein
MLAALLHLEAAISDPRHTIAIETFAANDLSELREDLRQAGLDSRHIAELIRGFLAERGYGVSDDDARKAASSNEILYGPLNRMQETLEQLAVSM